MSFNMKCISDNINVWFVKFLRNYISHWYYYFIFIP